MNTCPHRLDLLNIETLLDQPVFLFIQDFIHIGPQRIVDVGDALRGGEQGIGEMRLHDNAVNSSAGKL